MKVDSFHVSGPKLLTLKSFFDDRGFFCERFKSSTFREAGLPTNFVQDNFSRSKPKVLRGLHYQWDQPQSKLVTCTKGRIFDVAVDIRKGSPTFGQSVTVEISSDEPKWFWIPAGFAHGFCVLGNEEADVLYKCDVEYGPKGEGGILWSDPELKIDWPISQPILNVRDLQMQSFSDYQKDPRFVWKPE